MESYTFEDADDEFVFVSVSQAPSQEPFRQASLESTDDEGSRRSRSRSRGRTDSFLRKQRQQQAEVEKSASTALLVSNLREGCHEPFCARLASVVPADRLKSVHVSSEHNFGFLEFTDLESMHETMRRLGDFDINGHTISLSRCAAVTPGRNPRALDDEQPCDTIALKVLPLDLTMTSLKAELHKLPGLAPTELYFHVSPTGTFSGTVILRFAALEAALHAHRLLNGVVMLGRQVRAEYKRPDTRAAPRLYQPPCRESEMYFAKLKEFKASAAQSLIITTKILRPAIREQLTAIVAYLDLRALSNGETPATHVTILRPMDDRTRSRSSTASSIDRPASAPRTSSVASVSRTPKGPDGTPGFRPTDSGVRSAALAQTQPVDRFPDRSMSGTWQRGRPGSRLTGTN